MEGVVRGIQADMTKLSKSHSTTSNTVSKLLDKSRKLSVTMKEVSRALPLEAGGTSNNVWEEAEILTAVSVGSREDGAAGGPGEEAGGQPRPPGQQEQL